LNEKVVHMLELRDVKGLWFPEWAFVRYVQVLPFRYRALHHAEFGCPVAGYRVYPPAADGQVQPFGHWQVLWQLSVLLA
jgi:hypothetical protein